MLENAAWGSQFSDCYHLNFVREFPEPEMSHFELSLIRFSLLPFSASVALLDFFMRGVLYEP
jgi:hypothetical protein